MNVEAENIPLGADEALEITLFNQGSGISGNLYAWVEGGERETWNFTESVAVPGNSSVSMEFAFRPGSKGVYQIEALFDSESTTIGPRLSHFEVGEVKFEMSKKFRPAEVRLIKKMYLPPVNSPEIRIENTGILNITSVSIIDSLSAGFTIPGYNSERSIEIEDESFSTDSKIPVFIFMMTDQTWKEKRHGLGNWPSGKKIRMLNRKYYNASISGNGLSIVTEELAKTNFGRDLGKDDTLVIKYMMLSGKVGERGNLVTDTVARAFYGPAYSEKVITSDLKVR
jgi:hypothetical protein